MKRTPKMLVMVVLFASALLLPLVTAYAAPPTGVSATYVSTMTSQQISTQTAEGIQYQTMTGGYKFTEGPAGGFGGTTRLDYIKLSYPNGKISSHGTVTCTQDCTVLGKAYKGSWIMSFVGADSQGQWIMNGSGDLISLHGQGTFHAPIGNAPGRATGQIHFNPYTPMDTTYEMIPPATASNEKVVDGNKITTNTQDAKYTEGPAGGFGGMAHMELTIVSHPDNTFYYHGSSTCFQDCTVMGKAYKGSWLLQYIGNSIPIGTLRVGGGSWIISGSGDLVNLHGEGSWSASPNNPPSQITGYIYFDQ